MSVVSQSVKFATAGILLALAVDASAQVVVERPVVVERRPVVVERVVERPYYRHHYYRHHYGYGRRHYYRHHYRY